VSVVDTQLAPDRRAAYLDEVRYWLPAFLSGASYERTNALESIQTLLHLDAPDLRRTVAVHVLLHPAVKEFISHVRAGVRSPAVSTDRPRQLSRAVAGGIDWGSTSRARATGSPLEMGFVVRPAVRLFDVPENRVLAWLLGALERQTTLATSTLRSMSTTGWQSDIHHASETLAAVRRTTWLRGLSTARPSRQDFAVLRRSRKFFFRRVVTDAVRVVLRYTEDANADDVTELLTERWFEPARDWALFELVVLLRIERQLATIGSRDRLRLITASGPFSRIRLENGAVVRIWYQSWPDTAGDSEHLDAARHYLINTPGARPDIVIDVEHRGDAQGWLLELKASQAASYLGEGLLQLLGYMRDRPLLFEGEARGWLVAPKSAAMTSSPPSGRSLWVVADTDVATAAEAAVRGFAAD
jgi:hypothetical protein